MRQATPLPIVQSRSGLRKTRQCLSKGKLTIGFLGGSITDGRSGQSWAEPVISWFLRCYPQVRLSVENAAIGATGSDLAVFRVERDILQRHCDLVFVEYAVNDGEPTETTGRSREGLLRKLLSSSTCDVVLVHTFGQGMYQDMMNNKVPAPIAELEALAERYQLPSVWMGMFALREVMAGGMRWEDWLPDGLHPQTRGGLSYGQSVIQLLEEDLAEDRDTIENNAIHEKQLPTPLFAKSWERTMQLPFDQVQLDGPWVLRRHTHLVWIDQVLSTAAVGARLSFSFEGRGLALGFDFGKDSAEFLYRLDQGEWQTMVRDRPAWYFDSHWYKCTLIDDNLPLHEHTFELEVVHGNRPDCTGSNFSLAFIGIFL